MVRGGILRRATTVEIHQTHLLALGDGVLADGLDGNGDLALALVPRAGQHGAKLARAELLAEGQLVRRDHERRVGHGRRLRLAAQIETLQRGNVVHVVVVMFVVLVVIHRLEEKGGGGVSWVIYHGPPTTGAGLLGETGSGCAAGEAEAWSRHA